MSGEWNVDKMLSEMPAPLFNEWVAFWEMEPEGYRQIVDQIRQLTYRLMRSHGSKLKYKDTYIDYAEQVRRRRKEHMAKKIFGVISSIAATVNKRFERKK